MNSASILEMAGLLAWRQPSRWEQAAPTPAPGSAHVQAMVSTLKDCSNPRSRASSRVGVTQRRCWGQEWGMGSCEAPQLPAVVEDSPAGSAELPQSPHRVPEGPCHGRMSLVNSRGSIHKDKRAPSMLCVCRGALALHPQNPSPAPPLHPLIDPGHGEVSWLPGAGALLSPDLKATDSSNQLGLVPSRPPRN